MTATSMLLPAVSRSQRDHLDDVAVAVIGCGNHSTTAILPSLRHAPMRLVAVCDLDRGRAESARRLFGAEAAYTSMCRRDWRHWSQVVTSSSKSRRATHCLTRCASNKRVGQQRGS